MRKHREKGRSVQAASSKKTWPFNDSMLSLVPHITHGDTPGSLDSLHREVSDDVDSWSQWITLLPWSELMLPSSAVPQIEAQRKA